VLNKGTATFSWRELTSDKPLGDIGQARLHRIQADPRFQRAGTRQDRDRRDQAGGHRPRSRGRVWRPGQADRPGADRQRGILDGSGRRIVNGVGTVLVVLVILWMALHSSKIIFAVFVNLFIGLLSPRRRA